MKTHLYPSSLPEALIAANPTPDQCGRRQATSHRHQFKGQALS